MSAEEITHEVDPNVVETAPAATSAAETTTQVSGADQKSDVADGADGIDPNRDEKGRFRGIQPRIDELTRKRHEAEREAAYWRGVATQGKAQPSAEEAAAIKPTPDRFDDYGSYVEALAEWKADEKISKVLNEREAKATEKHQAETRTASWIERQTAALTEMPDYEAVVGGSDTPLSAHVADAILESLVGPALAYHLAKHPDVLERLNGLPPRQADREIGRLEERLAKTPVPSVESVKLSGAPKPAGVAVSQGRSTVQELGSMPMSDYAAQRRKHGARWAQ